MQSTSHEAIVTLSALGVSGRNWDNIMWQGGPRALLEGGPEALAAFARKGVAPDLERARKMAQDVEYFVRSGGHVLGVDGPHELGRLNRAPLPLLCAYLRGKRELVRTKPTVAIIGTRRPSHKGEERAYQYAAQLASAGCLVVSGGAIGVDLAAHKGALSAGGQTLAVLGEILQPMRDERPFRVRELEPSDAVTTLTPFAPWVKGGRSLFVVRNQYVAALADALIIIEGTLDSGTLHTARYAKQIGVPVWAVPGDPDNALNGAANLLLQEGDARALLGVETLLASLGVLRVAPKLEAVKAQTPLTLVPDVCEHPTLVKFLRQHAGRVTFDLLCSGLNEPAPKLQQDLLELELAGTIRREGTEFVLTAP
jgi:DNA processing protein